MVLKYLLGRLINNPQIIDKLADSYPIRQAARATAYAIQKSKIAAQEALETEALKKASNFQKKFSEELEKGFKEKK